MLYLSKHVADWAVSCDPTQPTGQLYSGRWRRKGVSSVSREVHYSPYTNAADIATVVSSLRCPAATVVNVCCTIQIASSTTNSSSCPLPPAPLPADPHSPSIVYPSPRTLTHSRRPLSCASTAIAATATESATPSLIRAGVQIAPSLRYSKCKSFF